MSNHLYGEAKWCVRYFRMSGLSEDILKNNFDLYDKDGSGSITLEELKQVYASFNISISESSLQYLVKKYDASGDGRIDYPEFVMLLTGKPPQQSAGVNKPAQPAQPQQPAQPAPKEGGKTLQGDWGI